MAIAVTPISQAAKKWSERATVATAQYEEGIRNPSRPQADAAIAAEDTWRQAMTAAIARNARVSGLRAAGSEKWARASLEKGAPRFGPGVTVSQPQYVAATQRYFDVIAGLTLSPRGPTNDPRNYARVPAVGNALHAAKVAAGGK